MPLLNFNPARLRNIFYGKRTLREYEKLAKYYKKNELQDMCEEFNIDYNPKATKLDLALLIAEYKAGVIKERY
jgi:hypothetical protein